MGGRPDTLEDGPEAPGPKQKSFTQTLRETRVVEQTRGKAGDSYARPAALGAEVVKLRPLVGVAEPVSRQRRLGGPLSPRAGRVAKEMTACSAVPRRAAPAGRGLERRRFRFRSVSVSSPVTASWAGLAPFTGTLRRRAAEAAPATRDRSAPGSGTGRGPLTCPEAAGQPPPWVPTFPSLTR